MRNIAHSFILDGSSVPELIEGNRATLITTLVDPDGEAKPVEQRTRVWRSQFGLNFHYHDLITALGLDQAGTKLKLELAVDTETLMKNRDGAAKFEDCTPDQQAERSRRFTDASYLTQEQAVLVAAASLVLIGFSPLAQLLVQPSLKGHARRLARRLPSVNPKERTLSYDEQDLGTALADRYCNRDGTTPDY